MKDTDSIVITVVQHLLENKVHQAIELLLPWLTAHGPAGLNALLAACPHWGLDRLIVLLSDLIETYPRRLLASPALMCVHPAQCVSGTKTGGFFTHEPYPGDKDEFWLRGPGDLAHQEAPGRGLRFLGWLPGADTYPVARAELTRTQGLAVPWGQITTVVAVFDSQTQDDELVQSVVPTWWSQFFAGSDCSVRITSPGVFKYAKAAEYARAMLARSGDTIPSAVYFLSVEEQRQAHRNGDVFRRDCQRHFPQRG